MNNLQHIQFQYQQNCEILIKYDSMKSACLETIFRMCNFDFKNREMTVFGRNPNEYSGMLARYCEDILAIIELNKSRNEDELTLINKYTNKWLYFEGYDCGSVVAKIHDIYKINGNYAFSGVLVKFNFDNNNFVGIETEYVENYSFEDLPYFYNDTLEEGIEEPISSTKCYKNYYLY